MGHAIGVDIGGTKIHIAIVNDHGGLVRQSLIPTANSAVGENMLAAVIAGIMDIMLPGQEKIDGIGVGCAGQIDFRTGEIAYAIENLPGWSGLPIKGRLRDAFELPVYVDNDANVIAIAEKLFGAGKALDSFICLSLGTGIGGAIMESGKLIRGVTGGAGELGHVSIDFNGPRCACGNYGCIELYASGTGIVRIAAEMARPDKRAGQNILSAREIVSNWTKGDLDCSKVMEQVIRALATYISGIIHVFNPQAVILGGGVSESGKMFHEVLNREIRVRTSPVMFKECKIITSHKGNSTGVIGAAAQVWHYTS